MFEQKKWVMACQQCKIKLSLGTDTIQNMVDYRGYVQSRCYESLCEFLVYAQKWNIHFETVSCIKNFIDQHRQHGLRIAPLVSAEFDEYVQDDYPCLKEEENMSFWCESCSQSCALFGVLFQEREVSKQEMSVGNLEIFCQILEIYNFLGLRVNSNRTVDSLEALLPFLRRHAGHKVAWQIQR